MICLACTSETGASFNYWSVRHAASYCSESCYIKDYQIWNKSRNLKYDVELRVWRILHSRRDSASEPHAEQLTIQQVA